MAEPQFPNQTIIWDTATPNSGDLLQAEFQQVYVNTNFNAKAIDDEIAKFLQDYGNICPLITRFGAIAKGSGDSLDIAPHSVLVEREDGTEKVRVVVPNTLALPIPSAVLDNVAVNLVKVKHKAVTPFFEITVDPAALTTKEAQLEAFTGVPGGPYVFTGARSTDFTVIDKLKLVETILYPDTAHSSAADADLLLLNKGGVVGGIAASNFRNILELLSTTKIDVFSTTSAIFVGITGLSLTITPKSTNNKILVTVHVSHDNSNSANINAFQLTRDGTPIAVPAAAGNRTVGTFFAAMTSPNRLPVASMTHLDSPASVAAITYQLEMKIVGATSTGFVNRTQTDPNNNTAGRTVSSITVMEIKG